MKTFHRIAAAAAIASLGAPPMSRPNWLQRLEAFSKHERIPLQARDDVARLLKQRELLLEFFNASRNFMNTVGAPMENRDLEEAVKIEQAAEKRMEDAIDAVLQENIV
jgi:hypothetical protein